MSFSIIAAHDKDLGIGYKNTIPWYIPDDFKWFKKHTMNKVVIMGMNTYFSLPKKFRPLPYRKNIVLCDNKERSEEIIKEGAKIYSSIDNVINEFKNDDSFIIGGSSIYKQFIDLSDKLYITEIDKEFKCDTYFPNYKNNKWTLSYKSDILIDEKSNIKYTFNIYNKKI